MNLFANCWRKRDFSILVVLEEDTISNNENEHSGRERIVGTDVSDEESTDVSEENLAGLD